MDKNTLNEDFFKTLSFERISHLKLKLTQVILLSDLQINTIVEKFASFCWFLLSNVFVWSKQFYFLSFQNETIFNGNAKRPLPKHV